LASFESNIRGVRALVDFAVSSPLRYRPQFIFISSIGIFQSSVFPSSTTVTRTHTHLDPKTEEPQAEVEIEPEVAVGTGYSESKWVAESILRVASDILGINTCVVRVGQLSGSASGVWNVKEWFPSMVEASFRLGYLPTFGAETVRNLLSPCDPRISNAIA
jgi:thioester reductase-like protein